MDETGSRILYIFIDIILPLAVGYGIKQKGLLSPQQCNTLIRFNIIVVMSILTLLSFWVLPLQAELLSLPFFAFFNALVPLAVILGLRLHRRFSSRLDRGSYLVTAMPSNTTALGGLCGYLLYGEIAFAYSQIIGIFQNLVMFFILFPMGYYYQHSGKGSHVLTFFRDNWKNVFINWNQLSLVFIAAGIVLYTAGVPRPAVLGELFQDLIHVSAWSALLPIGYLIDFSHLKQYCRPTLNLIPLKLVVTPLLSYLLAVQMTDNPVLLGSLLIIMGSPCAINALITARLYGLNVNLAMAPFITTTVLYIFLWYPLFYLLVITGYLPFR
ncbi:AEC family transporter [uncultured Megasphaera sp.]|uniref:AEC family transporter n=1 Tax=uncultured Megasphaera sp. TaxID=165188 RepID=UPI002658D653|nr:hypothetical protein [uncultured Megasphaera sp.]